MKKHLLITLLSALCLTTQAQDNNWTWGGPLDPAQATFDVKHYTLRLEVAPEARTIGGSADAEVELVAPTNKIRLNLIDAYTVSGVKVNGKKAKYTRGKDALDVQLKQTYQPGQRVTVTVDYAGTPPEAVRPPWQGGFTFTKDANGKHWIGLSSQNEGAKIFMPCKDHPSDEPDEGVEQYISVPAPYQVAANGVLVSEKKKGDQITYHWKTDYSINNYGINFTVGDFAVTRRDYTTMDGNTVPMVLYLLKQNADKAPELMNILEISLKTQEKYFGEYPFRKDKVGIVETPYLGMEHQTINAYGNKFRFTQVGDAPYDHLLHHELGHEWWGNKVSVKDWADFWIQEGLCTYGDWLFVEEHAGHEAYLKHVQQIGKNIPNRNPIIMRENNVDSDEAYHGEIYSKGAHVMHSLRYMLGDEVFFRTLKSFILDPAYTYGNQVKTADLQEYFTKETGYDIKPFFDLYLRTTEVPEVVVEQTSENNYSIRIPNIDFNLPMDVRTDSGTKRLELSGKPVQVTSTTAPVVDEKGWYLKKVVTGDKTL
ncbi:M1 family metallopeptidase [Pontibacter anaerobius]|uniref:M1 family metallopeptidase n=1 Tax=Pontibacter anaerobius TaxID=2993940 RepID=A0ABT3RAU1_9BACT|nr:M1 family metallopeptidase [Pontibacter anaerobius]MCX2738986.1 M1 family metallopeptidase [Pontibacter anaerobius]